MRERWSAVVCRSAQSIAAIAALLILGCSGKRIAASDSEAGAAGTSSDGAAADGASGVAGWTADDAETADAGEMADAGGAAADGGGPGAMVGPTFVDGTRLVAQTYSFPGTEPLFVGIFDRQENAACAFRIASDGQLRCLPQRKPNLPDPAPADRWQAGTELAVAATGLRLRQRRIVSLDGSAFPSWISGELLDDDSSEPCQPDITREKDGTGEGVCLPRHALATGIFFADAACTVPLAQPQTELPPVLIATPKREVFAVGAKVAGSAFTQFGMGAPCSEFPAGNGEFYGVGLPLPAGTVASVQLRPLGSERLMLETIGFQGAGVAHVRHNGQSSPSAADGPYYDRLLTTLCRPTWTVSGELRCLPADAFYEREAALTNFADPECTQPVVNSGTSSTVVLLRSDSAAEREVVIEVRRISPEYSTTGYSRQNNSAGECREYLRGSGHPLGDLIAFDSFAAVVAHTGQQ